MCSESTPEFRETLMQEAMARADRARLAQLAIETAIRATWRCVRLYNLGLWKKVGDGHYYQQWIDGSLYELRVVRNEGEPMKVYLTRNGPDSPILTRLVEGRASSKGEIIAVRKPRMTSDEPNGTA